MDERAEADAAEDTLQVVAGMIHEVVGGEWALDVPITMETSFNHDLELESIEFVSLAEKMQARYGAEVDFALWLSGMDLDEIIELEVGDVVRYIDGCR